MLSNLQNEILKELDRQNFKADIISFIMNKLDNEDKQNKFLSFMIDNRNVLISLTELLNKLKSFCREIKI